MTRNISGNAKVKKADAGFRQNATFVYRSCVPRSVSAFTTCPPPRR